LPATASQMASLSLKQRLLGFFNTGRAIAIKRSTHKPYRIFAKLLPLCPKLHFCKTELFAVGLGCPGSLLGGF